MMILGKGAEATIYLLEFEKGIKIGPGEKILIKTEDFEISDDEGIIKGKGKAVLKYRERKNYRHPLIDKNFRKYRTRREAKILEKLQGKINVPKLIYWDEDRFFILMEYVEGIKLREIFEKISYNEVAYKIGEFLGRMHNENIVWNDITTSNIILKGKEIYFIDFGLSYFSTYEKDKAVDLHLFKETLESKHWSIFEEAFKSFLEGYKNTVKNFEKIWKFFQEIEKRGRYK